MSDASPFSLSSAKAIKAAMLRARKPSPRGASDDFTLDYRAPNGRFFDVREYPDGRYLVSEMRPNCRLARYPEGGLVPHCWDEPRLKPLMDDPNGFMEGVRALGIDEGEVIRVGGGIGVGSRFFDTLDAVAAAVAEALEANRWYDDVDRALVADPEFQARLRRNGRIASAAFRAEERAMHERAVRGEHGLFKGLHSAIGPLDDDTKTAILSYLNAPDEERWKDIYSKCVKGFKTLWQAWAAVDPACPRSLPSSGRWPRIPDPETVRSALRAASGLDRGAPGTDALEETASRLLDACLARRDDEDLRAAAVEVRALLRDGDLTPEAAMSLVERADAYLDYHRDRDMESAADALRRLVEEMRNAADDDEAATLRPGR